MLIVKHEFKNESYVLNRIKGMLSVRLGGIDLRITRWGGILSDFFLARKRHFCNFTQSFFKICSLKKKLI